MRCCLLPLALLAACGGQESPFAGRRWVDLTHSFSRETIYWPTADEFTHTAVFKGITEKGYFYASYNFTASEHGGTHMDAPIHFAEGHEAADEIPVDRLAGPAAVVDVSERAMTDRDYQVAVADLEAWETKHGHLPEGAIVLLNTGSHALWPDKVKYMGTDERGPEAVAKLHFPGLHPDAARWLVKRRIRAVGLDTPSIDYGRSELFESHRILFEADIPAFENVANLGALPARGAYVIALPMKIANGSGGPLRIVALVG